uniref:Class I SAM-dependent methyltransferase n=1 Tax=Megaviridae environmental sample TaxID=1737588 RepID=A0A5J6VM67_9VIRU|nr:MAG: hypothetical protein [Megaviridae environmental sample]
MINEFVPAGHFYSVIPNIDHNYNNNKTKFLDLDFNNSSHLQILSELEIYLENFDNEFGCKKDETIETRMNELKYSLCNGAFEWMDARLLHYFIRKVCNGSSKKIIEVGSGWSTLMMYHTKKKFNLDLEIICIEPYPDSFGTWLNKLSEKNEITLIKKKLENINLDMFKTLNENDILFIDSSHVLKLDSDVMYYFTNIFPVLKKGVLIHIHDIFFPFDYPLSWLKEGRFWNEQYFLYVFLQFNNKFKITFCNSYSVYKYSELLKKLQNTSFEIKNNITTNVFGGGSIWLTVNK